MKLYILQLLIAILAVLTIKAVTSASKCPSECRCNKTIIFCIENDLEQIPDFSNIRTRVEEIYLSENELDLLGNDSFVFPATPQIKRLYLNGNSITDLATCTFSRLINLELLDLHDNLIGHIPPNIFIENTNLIVLNLAENLFTEHTPVIESESIEVLDLSYTRISKFSKENVQGLPNLRLLYLHENNLKYLDPNIFLIQENLVFLQLTHNIWKCDCNTTNMFKTLIQKGLVELEPIQCKQNGNYIYIYNKDGAIYDESNCSHIRLEKEKPNKANISDSVVDYFHYECGEYLCNPVNVTLLVVITLISIGIALGIIVLCILLSKRKTTYKAVNAYEMKRDPC